MRKTRNLRRMSAASHFIKRRKSQQSMLGPSKCLPELLPDCHKLKISKCFLVDVLELGSILFRKAGWVFSYFFLWQHLAQSVAEHSRGCFLCTCGITNSKIDRRHRRQRSVNYCSALDIMVGMDRRGQHFPTSENCDCGGKWIMPVTLALRRWSPEDRSPEPQP